jgi:DNA-3-methyladenine glycosylase II
MDYLLHLQKDKKLAKILTEPLPLLQMRQNIPLRLMASIMSQQLNTKVAKVIYKRFLEIFGGEEPEPKQVLDTSFETLRGIGLSNAKVNYVQNVARFCIEHEITDTKLLSLSNEEIIDLLTQIKGVGKWTVEMLLMFTLGREDVFAVDDLGIQQAMMRVYKIPSEDKKAVKEKMLKISSKWSPYRTYACLHLWNWKDTPLPVE